MKAIAWSLRVLCLYSNCSYSELGSQYNQKVQMVELVQVYQSPKSELLALISRTI